MFLCEWILQSFVCSKIMGRQVAYSVTAPGQRHNTTTTATDTDLSGVNKQGS